MCEKEQREGMSGWRTSGLYRTGEKLQRNTSESLVRGKKTAGI